MDPDRLTPHSYERLRGHRRSFDQCWARRETFSTPPPRLDERVARDPPACTVNSALPICPCVGVHSISCTLDDCGVRNSPACTAHSASPLCSCVGVHSTSCIRNVCSDRKTPACPVVGDLPFLDRPACPACSKSILLFTSACPMVVLDLEVVLDKISSACLARCPR